MTREQILDRAVRDAAFVTGLGVVAMERAVGRRDFISADIVRYIRRRFAQIAAIESMKEKQA